MCKSLAGETEDWRYSHVIRFSQIDGAGIVYYPRYFEMLADSFPQQCAVLQPAAIDLSFHHPVRLGQQLQLEQKTTATEDELLVDGCSGGKVCFEFHMSELQQAKPAAWANRKISGGLNEPFARKVQIRDWMTGADSRLHLGRCYELTAVLMEEWFADSLSCPFATLQSADGALVPTVKLQTDVYELPVTGDWLTVSLCVLHVGRSSLQMGMDVMRDDRLLVQTRQTIVFVQYQDKKLTSVAIPEHLLEPLHQQLFRDGPECEIGT